MRNIWIDGYEANVTSRVGSGQVGIEILKALEKLDHQNNYTILLPSKPLSDMPVEREGWRYKVLRPNKLWTWIAVPLAIAMARSKPDVVFSPTHYIPRVSGIKRVMMVFDLAFLKFPQYFLSKDLYKLKNWTKYSVDHADHIITISNSSKKDIEKEYKVNPGKVTVAYPGYDAELFKPNNNKQEILDIKKKYKINRPYVLYIGTLQPRKNLIRLMQAIKNIPDIELVIVGKSSGDGRQGWMYEETVNYPKVAGIDDKVIFTGYVDKLELPILLRGAICYVLPSLYEGFGMPVLDAMAVGTPVIVSNVSSLPEVVGKAGLLVDPEKIEEIEQAIRLLVTDVKRRKALVNAGFEQAKKFSWNKMVETIRQVLDTV